VLFSEFLGFLGGALTSLGYIPQLVRIFKLKSAHEISLPFTFAFLVGALCWLTYGILSSLMPVIIWNSAGVILLCILVYGKIKYGK
jgi:MtN3 and saliva related transmembrane protein